jgi:transglutaminase-like putative cysteine protease
VQSDDSAIIEMAAEAAGEAAEPWKVATALERYVNQAIREVNFAQALATAADVAQTKEGDCTEHAVLLAALARARGIPARAAIGLVYVEAKQELGFHMWNELYLDGRWVPFDGTLGRGGIGGGHLKLSHSSLSGSEGFSAFLPVAQVMGRLKVEVLEVQ